MADQRSTWGVVAVLGAAAVGAGAAWWWSHRSTAPVTPPSATVAERGRANRPQRPPRPTPAGAPTLVPIVPPEATPPAGSPSVLLVTMDTTRADHLGLYGYFRDTSPVLDALAQESVVFTRYTVPMSITLPSHMSVFTGTYPDEHGVVANVAHGGKRFVPSPKLTSVAQYLGTAGWVTAGIVSSSPLKKYTGVNQGFQSYYEPEGEARHARETTDLALAWIEAAPDRPFFLWVHYFDPHWPYLPPGRWAEAFRGKEPEAQDRWLAERRAIPADLSPEKVKSKLDKYDGEIYYMDQNIGRLIEGLKRKGVWDELVVVAVGDHGEGLMQHDYPSHGHIWTEQLNAPFLLRVPGVPPARVDAPVSAVDVLPTLLGRVDFPDERAWLAQVSGRDALSTPARPVAFRTSQVQHDKATDRKFEKPVTWGVTDEDWVYQAVDGGPPELYRRSTDPHELDNVAAAHPDVVARLAAETTRQRSAQAERGAALGAGQMVDLTDDERAALAALGYVDGEPHPEGEEDAPPARPAPRTGPGPGGR